MHWCIEVSGEPSDLRMLAESLSAPLATLDVESEKYILSSTTFDGLDSPNEVAGAARELLAQISGAARILLGSPSSLSAGNVFRVLDDGRRSYFVQPQPARLVFRGLPPSVIVGHPDGTQDIQRPADPVRRIVEAASSDESLAKALRLRDRAALGWSELYRLYELIKGALGIDEIVARGWTSRSEAGRFTHSANSVGASGDDARHGVETTKPPTKPMSIGQAQRFVDALLEAWWRERAS